MTTAEILSLARANGVQLSLEGGRIVARPKGAISDQLRQSIIANREALQSVLSATKSATELPPQAGVADVAHVAHLEGAIPAAVDDCRETAAVAHVAHFAGDGQEARRRRVLAMLAERQAARCAVLTDTEADPEAVILTLAIRGVGTCELRIPRPKYDPFLLLLLIERHGGTMQ